MHVVEEDVEIPLRLPFELICSGNKMIDQPGIGRSILSRTAPTSLAESLCLSM